MDRLYTIVSLTPFASIVLKSDNEVEFKVNGQRVKHYLEEELPKAKKMNISE